MLSVFLYLHFEVCQYVPHYIYVLSNVRLDRGDRLDRCDRLDRDDGKAKGLPSGFTCLMS